MAVRGRLPQRLEHRRQRRRARAREHVGHDRLRRLVGVGVLLLVDRVVHVQLIEEELDRVRAVQHLAVAELDRSRRADQRLQEHGVKREHTGDLLVLVARLREPHVLQCDRSPLEVRVDGGRLRVFPHLVAEHRGFLDVLGIVRLRAVGDVGGGDEVADRDLAVVGGHRRDVADHAAAGPQLGRIVDRDQVRALTVLAQQLWQQVDQLVVFVEHLVHGFQAGDAGLHHGGDARALRRHQLLQPPRLDFDVGSGLLDDARHGRHRAQVDGFVFHGEAGQLLAQVHQIGERPVHQVSHGVQHRARGGDVVPVRRMVAQERPLRLVQFVAQRPRGRHHLTCGRADVTSATAAERGVGEVFGSGDEAVRLRVQFERGDSVDADDRQHGSQ